MELMPNCGAGEAVRGLDCSAVKTLLVPVSGSETDRVVFCTARAIAQPLQGHLKFLHLRLKPEEAAVRAPHVEFCVGPAMRDALAYLAHEQANLSVSAANYVKQFCLEHDIAFTTQPSGTGTMSAEFMEESTSGPDALLFHARRNDLTVLGRAQHVDCLPRTLIEDVLLNSGRPLLVVPKSPQWPLLGTVIVGWKESAASARAIGAALPLLRLARRVVIINVAEGILPGSDALNSVREQLAWHGITAEVQRLGDGIARAEALLPDAMANMKAGLLVVGGFSHSRLRDSIFGGVTHSLLNKADFPLFLAH